MAPSVTRHVAEHSSDKHPIGQDPDRWFSDAEVANYIGRSLPTLKRYRRLGIGPKFGRIPNPETGRPIYYGRDVIAWLEQSRVCLRPMGATP